MSCRSCKSKECQMQWTNWATWIERDGPESLSHRISVWPRTHPSCNPWRPCRPSWQSIGKSCIFLFVVKKNWGIGSRWIWSSFLWASPKETLVASQIHKWWQVTILDMNSDRHFYSCLCTSIDLEPNDAYRHKEKLLLLSDMQLKGWSTHQQLYPERRLLISPSGQAIFIYPGRGQRMHINQ